MLRPDFPPHTDKRYLRDVQYAGMTNYQHRKNIYQHGINIPLIEWISKEYNENYDLSNFDDILEVGCGNGEFWQRIARTDLQSHVCITDISEKMLAQCKHNLSEVKVNAEYQLADIDALPFGEIRFNCVLAHNVIYHAEDPEKAIIGVHKVLKQSGILGMSVLNRGVNQSIWRMANSIDPQVPAESFTSRFSDIEADKVLPTVFTQIEKKDYFNKLRFKTSEPIIDMVKSSPVMQSLNLSDNFYSLFKEKIDEKIGDEGYFESEFNASFYLCRKT